MAITATVFAFVHLVMVGVTFEGLSGKSNSLGSSVPGLGKAAWLAVASTLPALDAFLPMVFYDSQSMSTNYIIGVIAAACEVGRLLTAMFLLKAMALAARDFQASERSGYGIMIVLGVIGGVAILALFVVILLREGKFTSISTVLNLALGTVFLMYLAYTLMMLSPAIGAMATKDACAPPLLTPPLVGQAAGLSPQRNSRATHLPDLPQRIGGARRHHGDGALPDVQVRLLGPGQRGPRTRTGARTGRGSAGHRTSHLPELSQRAGGARGDHGDGPLPRVPERVLAER